MTYDISDCNNIPDNNSKQFYRHPQYLLVLDLDDIFYFPDVYLDIANIEMWMPIVLQEHFPHLQLAKIISNPFRLHYNVLVLIEVKESQEDSYYNAILPNSSKLPEDSNSYDANQDSYISRNPEPLIKYAAASSSSSSMQRKLF